MALDDRDHTGQIVSLGMSAELRIRLHAEMTPEDREKLSIALALKGEQVTPKDDILLLWEGVHGGPRLHELANVFRVSNMASIAAAVVDEWLRNNRQ